MSYYWRHAATEARSLGLNYVGADHLLLAILRSDRTVAGRALAECGVRYAAARDLVRRWSEQSEPGPIRRRRSRTPRVRRLVRVGTTLAHLRGRQHAADIDVLIALMYSEGPHEGILESAGTRRAAVVDALSRSGATVPIAPPIPECPAHDVSVLVPAEDGRMLLDLLTARSMLDPDRYFPYGRARWGFNYTKDPAVWRFSADREVGLRELVNEITSASPARP